MKIYLCDDNESHLSACSKRLKQLSDKHGQKMEISCFTSGEELLFHMEDDILDTIDAIFLDINMPNINGITVAEKLRSMNYAGEIIFLTVSENHFLSAFDVGAFNYILKNDTSHERFDKVFLKIIDTLKEKESEYILLSGGGEHRKVELSSIHFFEIQKRIVTVYYKDTSFEFFSTMEKLENQLYNKGFLRVHRAFLVAVKAIEKVSYNMLELKNGTEIPIGRTYQKPVQDYVKNHV